MLTSIAKWIILALGLIAVAWITPGMEISGFFAALISVAVIALVNIFIKPLVMFLTLPINILTLGLFMFVINALMFGLAAFLVPGFSLGGFFPALLGSLLYSIVSLLVNMTVKRPELA